MSWRDKQIINILNYNESVVTISTRDNEYAFNPSEGGVPSIIPLSPSEIEYVNSNSNAFKSGLLRFPEDIQEEIYIDLRIADWKSILTNDEIVEILTNATMEGLQRIIDIKNVCEFERVRGLFTRLKNTNDGDISIRVGNIVQKRYKELCNRQIKSHIQLVERDLKPKMITSEEVDSLKEELAQMREMMAKMLNSNSKAEIRPEDVKGETSEVKKPAGRPPKSSKQ